MAGTSDRFGLPLLAAAQAQKEITHNEALTLIDGLLHASALTRVLSVPPFMPLPGQAWIVAASATGEWIGMEDRLAIWTAGGWRFASPREGMLVWLIDAGVFAVYRSGDWRSDAWSVGALEIGARIVLGGAPPVVALPAGGVVIDVQARAALAQLSAALLDLGLLAEAVA